MSIRYDIFIRRPELLKMTGLSSTTIYRLEKSNKFPRRRLLSERVKGWLLSEVIEWMESRQKPLKTNKKEEKK